jgi:multidrug efflux pump subunit AcrA (membrane-fusion protein)
MTIGDVIGNNSINSSSNTIQTRKLSGTVKASDQVDLAFQVGGTLIDLPVEERQQVKKGDLIASLDIRDFISNLNYAKGVWVKANASVEFASAEYQRYRNIKASNTGAVSDWVVSLKQTLCES